MANPAEPERPRRLGRSRVYTAADISGRLRHWHAARVNRWERLRVGAGTLAIEWLGATGVTAETFATGTARWFAPGVRWRVAEIAPDARFELEVYADSTGQAEAPQLLRSALLEEAERVTIPDAAAFEAFVGELHPGERYLIEGCFNPRKLPEALFADRRLFWHPLESTGEGFCAFAARGAQAFDLATYLGRDHAVIEAALGGALAGDAESDRRLRATLARHLRIEEDLIFPAYVEAGGREAWVRSLRNEHRYLRRYLAKLDRPDSRRKFLRLLDGHDEKEERVVYPDILAHLGARAGELLVPAITFPVPDEVS